MPNMIYYKLHHFKSLASTQDKAKEFAGKGLSDVIVVADMQTKGRGRFRRKWHSAKGGLWISILLKPKNIDNLQCLTFAAAVAVVKSIKKICSLKTSIKWPNDVHYRGKKLCGILTEGIFPANYVAVGIGVNVNQDKFPGEIKNIATSLKIIKNKTTDIKKLSKNIADGFFSLYHNHYNKDNPEKILKIWEKYCDTINKDIIVTTMTRKLSGKAIGIGKDCSLLVELHNKKIIKVLEGDVSVRY